MKDLKKAFKLNCWLLILFLFFPTVENNAQVKKMTAKDLVNQSTAVLYGKCTKKRCEWNENKSIIYTYVTIVPEEYIKGNLGSEAVIAVPGGQVGDIRYEVSEMPVFTEGEDVMAFTFTNKSGKNLITGGYLGKLKIERDSKTGKRMIDASDIDTEADTQTQGIEKPARHRKLEALEDFIAKLKSYLKH